MMEKQRNNLIWLGTIVNTHGIEGEVRILSDSDEPEKRFAPGNKLIYFKNNTELTLTIKSYRFHKNFILATFEGYNNINDIEFIKGNKVYIPKGDKKLLIDYIGYKVVDANKGIIGTISDIKSESPYDNLYVNHNGKIINIPMIDKFVLKTDDLNKLIKVNIPEEFLN